MLLSFFIASIISFIILKKKLSFLLNFFYLALNLILILIYYEFIFSGFENDSSNYYRISSFLYENYSFFDIIQKYFDGTLYNNSDLSIGDRQHLSHGNNGIYYLIYLSFKIFGHGEYALPSFYLITKSTICIYLYNILKRRITNFNKYKVFYFVIFLFEPWTIYFNSLYQLKEGIVFFLIAIIILNFYKLVNKFKIKYFIILLISVNLIYFFRFYYAYLLVCFFVFYIFFVKYKKKLFLFLSLFLIVLIFPHDSLIFFNNKYPLFKEVVSNNDLSLINPIKFLLSPFFKNLIYEENVLKIICALIHNLITLVFLIAFLCNNYKNNFINYLYLFVIFISLSQIFAPDVLLTGGRHKSAIMWIFPALICYFLSTKLKKVYVNNKFS